jgi:hypothetical protein
MTPDRNLNLSYDEEERIRTALAEAAQRDGLAAPARVEAALLGELRRRNRRDVAVRVLAAGAIAATVLVGLWSTRPGAPAPAAAPVIAQVPTPIPEPPPTIAKATPPPPVRRARPRPVERRVAPVETAEFIPVGAWQALEPMERGTIVRVRLPKSSLPGFGIPVSADRWNESFPADVVLGEDGSMRAIRFVSNVQ